MLEKLVTEHEETVRLEAYLLSLGQMVDGRHVPEQVARFMNWLRERLERLRAASTPESIDARLAREKLFDAE